MMLTRSRYARSGDNLDPCDMQTMKHFTEVLALGLMPRLDTDGGMPTTWTVKNKMRQFRNQWEREHHRTIPKEVKESVAPVSVIQGAFGSKG
jgi:hypothetical protein